MENKTVAYISIAFFALGFVGLWVSFEQPKTVTIQSVNASMDGTRVVLNGTIESRWIQGNQLYLELIDGNRLRAIAFNASETEKQWAKKGSRVKVVGKISYDEKIPLLRVEKLELSD